MEDTEFNPNEGDLHHLAPPPSFGDEVGNTEMLTFPNTLSDPHGSSEPLRSAPMDTMLLQQTDQTSDVSPNPLVTASGSFSTGLEKETSYVPDSFQTEAPLVNALSRPQRVYPRPDDAMEVEPAVEPPKEAAPPVKAKPVAKRTRKKKDPNAPASVSSAYAFFFKETQASVKTHNPNAKFGEVSKIVASMWEALGEEDKQKYRKLNEEDKARHEREMNEYREKLELQAAQSETAPEEAPIPRVIRFKKAPARRKAKSQPVINDDDDDDEEEDEEDEHVEDQEKETASVNNVVVKPVVLENVPTDNFCIRKGCNQMAVKNIEWEDEYCSNECVVVHCANVFSDWVSVGER